MTFTKLYPYNIHMAKKGKKKSQGRAKKTIKPDKVSPRPKSKMGRSLRKFTEETVKAIEQMALDNCHVDTIAMALDIPKQTVVRRFGTFITQKRAEGRVTLRRSQRIAAESGNPALLIFLGKNELEQTDKQEREHTISKETATLLGMIDGNSKGRLPNKQESKDAG